MYIYISIYIYSVCVCVSKTLLGFQTGQSK